MRTRPDAFIRRIIYDQLFDGLSLLFAIVAAVMLVAAIIYHWTGGEPLLFIIATTLVVLLAMEWLLRRARSRTKDLIMANVLLDEIGGHLPELADLDTIDHQARLGVLKDVLAQPHLFPSFHRLLRRTRDDFEQETQQPPR
jgi:hypothetical protein